MPKALLDFEPVLNSLCPKWTPLKLRGLMVHWLRQHFADSRNFFEPGIGESRVWKPSDDTGILIETSGRWRPQTTEKRPALIVKRAAIQPVRQGIGDRLMGQGAQNVGRQLFSTLMTTKLIVLCIAAEDGEADTLAAEVYNEMLKFAIKFTEQLGFVRVMMDGVGELGKLEESKEHFAVPVSQTFAFWESWELTNEDSPLVRRISTTINLNLA